MGKPQTWDFIETTYLSRSRVKMLELVRHIKNSGSAGRLFAFTSLDRLVVSIDENIDMHREALHVSFDLRSNEWHFKYYAVRFKVPEFERTYTAEKGIEKFDKFLKMIRW